MRREQILWAADPLDDLVAWIYEAIHSATRDVWTWAAEAGIVRPAETSIVAPVHQAMTALVFASYAALVVVGGLIVMSHETLQTRYSVKEILPRLVMGLGLAWASPLILDGAISLTSDIVWALIDLDNGELKHFAFTAHDPESLLTAIALMYINQGVSESSLMAVLSAVLMLIGTAVLLITAVMRWLAMLSVVALAPLALACHGLPHTEGAARLWWRVLAACMVSCIGQAGCLFLWRHIVFGVNGVAREKFDTFPDDTSGYYLGVLYMVITIWAMWKVHTEAFRWARGRPVRIPGARMVAGMVAWRTMDRLGVGRRHRRRNRGGTSETAKPTPDNTMSTDPAPSNTRMSFLGAGPGGQGRPVTPPRINKKVWNKATTKPHRLQPRARVTTGPVEGRGKRRAHLPILPHSRINPARPTPTPQHGANVPPTPAETTGAGPGTPTPPRFIGPIQRPDPRRFAAAQRAYNSKQRNGKRRGGERS